MSKYLISIIILTYNREKYIQRTLDSLLPQMTKDCQLVCIDDGSTDNTYSILKEKCHSENNIELFRFEKNKGIATARNCGLKKAKGEYIYFVDSDDYLEPNTINVLKEGARSGVDFVVYNARSHYEDEVPSDIYFPHTERKNDYSHFSSGVQIYHKLRQNNEYYCMLWQHLFRRKFIKKEKIVFTDGYIHEDLFFTFKAYLMAKKVSVRHELIYNYCRHIGSETFTKDKLYSIKGLLRRMEDVLQMSYKLDTKDVAIRQAISLEIYHSKEDIRIVLDYCKDDEIEYILSKLRKHHLGNLLYLLLSEQVFWLKDKDVELLTKYKKIYIYGAGKFAQKLYFETQRKGISVSGFVISQKENERTLFNHKIYTINDILGETEKTIFLIGVSNQYKSSVIDTLEMNKLSYLVVSNYTEFDI